MTEITWVPLGGDQPAEFAVELAKAGPFGERVARFPFGAARFYGFLPSDTPEATRSTLRGMYVMPADVGRGRAQPAETCLRFLAGDPSHRRIVLRDPGLLPGQRLTQLERGDEPVVVGDDVLHVFSASSAKDGLELPRGEYPLIAVATVLPEDVEAASIAMADVMAGAVGVLVAGWDAEAWALADRGFLELSGVSPRTG